VDDLEKCKENSGKKSAGSDAKKPAAKAPVVPVPQAARAAAASKFIASAPKAAEADLSDDWTAANTNSRANTSCSPERLRPQQPVHSRVFLQFWFTNDGRS